MAWAAATSIPITMPTNGNQTDARPLSPAFQSFGARIGNVVKRLKALAVENALKINQPDPCDGLDILSKVGGFEIGGLAGAILGAAANRRPIIIDGFISTAAAMIAATIAPRVKRIFDCCTLFAGTGPSPHDGMARGDAPTGHEHEAG